MFYRDLILHELFGIGKPKELTDAYKANIEEYRKDTEKLSSKIQGIFRGNDYYLQVFEGGKLDKRNKIEETEIDIRFDNYTDIYNQKPSYSDKNEIKEWDKRLDEIYNKNIKVAIDKLLKLLQDNGFSISGKRGSKPYFDDYELEDSSKYRFCTIVINPCSNVSHEQWIYITIHPNKYIYG